MNELNRDRKKECSGSLQTIKQEMSHEAHALELDRGYYGLFQEFKKDFEEAPLKAIYLLLNKCKELIRENMSANQKIKSLEEQLKKSNEIIKSFKERSTFGTKDPLTKLYNREGCIEKFLETLNDARTNSFDISLLYLDLDGLKKVNDTYGHDCGDEIIKTFTKVLCSNTRDSDIKIVSRDGGDEFLLIIRGGTKVAEMIKKRIVSDVNKAKVMARDQGIKCNWGVSIGICVLAQNAGEHSFSDGTPAKVVLDDRTRPGKDLLGDLKKKADKAMYEEKIRKKDSR